MGRGIDHDQTCAAAGCHHESTVNVDMADLVQRYDHDGTGAIEQNCFRANLFLPLSGPKVEFSQWEISKNGGSLENSFGRFLQCRP